VRKMGTTRGSNVRLHGARRSLACAIVVASCCLGSIGAMSCAEETVPLTTSWVLVGASDCAAAGIEDVEVSVTSAITASSTFACADGLDPARVDLGAFERGIVRVEIRGLSSDGAVSWEGAARVDLRGDRVDISLPLVSVAEDQ